MKTREYKTISGLFKAIKDKQITVRQLFGGESVYLNGKSFIINLSDEARTQAAEIFSKYLASTKPAQKRIFENIKKYSDGLDYFQCFYLVKHRGAFYCSNSLSGEAFDYCKRMYLKHHC